MKNPVSNSLNTLVQILNDGIEFYTAASAQVHGEQERATFASLVEIRQFALAYLQPYVVLHTGSPELGHTFGGVLHRAYNTMVDTDNHQVQLQQLELVEDETLNAMQQLLQTSGNLMVISVIKELLPRMKAARHALHALHGAQAA